MASSIYHWFGQTFRQLGQIYHRFSEIMSSRVKSAFKLLLWPTIYMASSIYHWFGQTFRRLSEIMSSRVKSAFKLLLWPTTYMASILICWFFPITQWQVESVNGLLLVLSVALGVIMIRPMSSPRIDDLNQFKNVSEIDNLERQLSNYNRNVMRTGSWVAGVMIGLIVISLGKGHSRQSPSQIINERIIETFTFVTQLTDTPKIIKLLLPTDRFVRDRATWADQIWLLMNPICSILLGVAIVCMVKRLLNVLRWNSEMSRLQFKGIKQAYETRSHEATVENSTKDTD